MCTGDVWITALRGATSQWKRSRGESRASAPAAALNPFPLVRDHVLLPRASRIAEVDAGLAARLTRPVLEGIVGLIPTTWLAAEGAASDAADAARSAYLDHFARRLAAPRAFVTEAVRAHDAHV